MTSRAVHHNPGLVGRLGDGVSGLLAALFPSSRTGRVAVLATILTGLGHALASFAVALTPARPPQPLDALEYLLSGRDAWLLGLLAPVLLVSSLGAVGLDDRAWKPLGPLATCDMTTCEPPRPGRLLLRPYNAHSSHAQIAAGGFILSQAWGGTSRAPLAACFMGASLVILGSVSYVWWASCRELAGHYDHLMMEIHTAALPLLFLSTAMPDAEPALLLVAVLWSSFRAATFPGRAAMLNVAVLAYGTALAAVLIVGGGGDLRLLTAALGATLYGFVPKVAVRSGACSLNCLGGPTVDPSVNQAKPRAHPIHSTATFTPRTHRAWTMGCAAFVPLARVTTDRTLWTTPHHLILTPPYRLPPYRIPRTKDAAQVSWCWWGTAAFHYAAAGGFTLFFMWAQTLPGAEPGAGAGPVAD